MMEIDLKELIFLWNEFIFFVIIVGEFIVMVMGFCGLELVVELCFIVVEELWVYMIEFGSWVSILF